MPATSETLWLMQHVPAGIFVLCFGACVGSFINVVNHRLPAGMSVITPPSRCPVCGIRLRFFRENLPIIGWFLIRGRCRTCKARVSPIYMFVELLVALIFLGLYLALYAAGRGTPWISDIGGPWWVFNQFYTTWPMFFALAFLLAGLVSMTMIDARTCTIPIQIPVFVTVTAFVAAAIQAYLPYRPRFDQAWPIPSVGWQGSIAAFAAMGGVLFSCLLLRTGKLRYSFADYHEYVDENETIGDYPHGRREMALEIVFLLPCIVLGCAGWYVAGALAPAGEPPAVVVAVGSSVMGYLVGGALIWGIRIFGTLVFGKEAMGLGDVHLLAAVGAVLGWFEPILVFFIAPFFGIAWAMVSALLGSFVKTLRREMPYGPHLALATFVVIACRPGLEYVWSLYVSYLPWPGSS
ncbi:MAG: prepilin peptidase [Planctomycetota bacterium]|jgi:leader peptidase (prepilin peptidase)/N-methyltransferase